MDADLEVIRREAAAIRQGFLLTTNERKLAKARAETLKARAQLETVKAEAAAARTEAAQLREHIISSATESKLPSGKVILAWGTIILMLGAITRITYVGYHRPSVAASVVSSAHVEPPHHRVLTHKPESPREVQFKKAMNRLQDDLDSLAGSEPEIVQEVNQRYAIGPRPCPLEWVNHEAALSLDGTNERIPPTLLSAVNRCADAIEKLRDEKESAHPISRQ